MQALLRIPLNIEATMDDRALVDRYQGCLVGLALGDALGAPVEGVSAQGIEHRYGRLTEMIGGGWLDLRPGQVTDDTQMMLCIARSLVERHRFEAWDIARRFLRWLETDPKDVGNITLTALHHLKSGVPWNQAGRQAHEELGGFSAGNGAIMRCAPIALFHRQRPEALVADSITSSLITHWDPQARWAAAALNLAIVRLLEVRREGLLETVASEIKHPEVTKAVRSVAALAPQRLQTSGFVLHTLQTALWCFLHTQSFEEALITVVNLGGDADTQGAVCGALAGAWYGYAAIPQRWMAPLEYHQEIKELAEQLYLLSTQKESLP